MGSHFPLWDVRSYFPDQIKPSSPALGGRSLTTGPPGKTLLFFFERKDICHSKEIATSLMYLFWKYTYTNTHYTYFSFSVSNRYLIFLGLIKYFFSLTLLLSLSP